MLTFVCFKWQRIKTGFQLPSVCNYTARHVNVLRNMLARHVHVPHRLICVTDAPAGIDPRIAIVPLWDRCRELGGCYNRLWVFSDEAAALFGERFICIDLDCVLTGDCTSLFTRSESFVMNSYNPAKANDKDQFYNGSMIMMDAGCRKSVWDQFDPVDSLQKIAESGEVIGTDQAWIRLHLGKCEARWTNADGVYEARQVGYKFKPDARLIFFSGRRDPSQYPYQWVARHWR